MSAGTISNDVFQMIEEKRKKAIELRKRKIEEKSTIQPALNPPSQSTSITANSKTFKSNHFVDNGRTNSYTEIKNYQIKEKLPNAITSAISKPQTSAATVCEPKNERKPIKMSVVLVTSNRFSVSVEYDSDIINIFQKTTSKQWDPSSKKWSFDIKDFYDIFSKVKELKHLNITFVDSIPESVITALMKAKQKTCEVDLTERLNAKFIDGLYDFQKDGLIYGIKHDGKCLIADDMGLGKTVQAIGLAIWYREDWPLIIVCPSSLRYQWMNCLFKWIDNLSKDDVFVAKNTKDIFPKVPITITSYDLMSRMKNRFTVETNRFYKIIIMDESHYIKSDITQRTSTAVLIAKSCKRIILLSGTPALSRPIELFPQLNIIDKNLFPSKHGFGVRYCNAQQKTIFRNRNPLIVWDYKGANNLDELRIILENTIMVRRLKKDVLSQLPSKKREMVCLSTDHLQEKERNMMHKYKNDIMQSNRKDDKASLALAWFSKSAILKVQAVNEFILDILKRDIKLICFCHHKTMMDGVEEMLTKEKVNHIRIDGSTPPKLRQEACDVFQQNETFKVALLSLTACATGLNLTAATMVIFAETYWNPGVLAQAEDRVHRIGQQENVRVIYLLARGTIDELIWPLISKKLDILNKAGLSRDTLSDGSNPLEINENQPLITEFINALDSNGPELMMNFDES